MIVKFSDWQLALMIGGLVSLSIEWGGGGWAHGTWHMGPGEEFELGEVNAHGMCASATNKQ